MDLQRLAGIALILGFVLFAAGAALSPPGIYNEPIIAKRLDTIKNYRTRWNTSQLASALGIIAPALGFLLLAQHLRTNLSPELLNFGAGAFILSAAFAAIYLYRFALDPASSWERTGPDFLLMAAALLFLLGGFLYGLVFIRSHFPAWLGYLTAGYTVVGGAAYLILSLPAFYILGVYFVILLIQGIVLVL